jgi:hypothetical protein
MLARRLFLSVSAKVEKSRLSCSVFLQLCHLVRGAFCGLFLFALAPAFRLVFLSLLPCVFFLSLRKRRSASWHTPSPQLICFMTGR